MDKTLDKKSEDGIKDSMIKAGLQLYVNIEEKLKPTKINEISFNFITLPMKEGIIGLETVIIPKSSDKSVNTKVFEDKLNKVVEEMSEIPYKINKIKCLDKEINREEYDLEDEYIIVDYKVKVRENENSELEVATDSSIRIKKDTDFDLNEGQYKYLQEFM